MGGRSRKKSDPRTSFVPAESIEHKILLIRGEKVIIDADLAALYGVETRSLNQQVIRNLDRFPADFMFQLTRQELRALISHFATSNGGRGGRTKLPYAFTEHGAIMAASVLNTPRAVEMSVFVVRAFVRLRTFLATHKELAEKLAELERKLASHDGRSSPLSTRSSASWRRPRRPNHPGRPTSAASALKPEASDSGDRVLYLA